MCASVSMFALGPAQVETGICVACGRCFFELYGEMIRFSAGSNGKVCCVRTLKVIILEAVPLVD